MTKEITSKLVFKFNDGTYFHYKGEFGKLSKPQNKTKIMSEADDFSMHENPWNGYFRFKKSEGDFKIIKVTYESYD